MHKPIGLLGGTFDPIHFGHLRMALELHEQLNLETVHLIPCFTPVHRKNPVASSSERLAMVECAVSDEPTLIADSREITRMGPSYTVDTLENLRETMPTTPLCLLIGIDAFLHFPSWHRYERILQLAHVIVAHRPLYRLPETGVVAQLMAAHLQKDITYLHHHLAGAIMLRPITALDISATDIRKQIAAGKNPRYLLPDAVLQRIRQSGTYTLR